MKCYKTAEGYEDTLHSIYLSTALQRAALTSSRQLRYEQAKHVDGLQSDGWILLKCFRSRVMVGSAMKKSLVTDSAGWCFSVYSASTRI